MGDDKLLDLVETLIKDLANTQRDVELLKAHNKTFMVAFQMLTMALESKNSLSRDDLAAAMSSALTLGREKGVDERALEFLERLRDGAFLQLPGQVSPDKAH